MCQEVDDIVGQDAVKYFENQVQNVGDSVKRFYSDVVQEVLPLPPLVNSVKHGYHSVALNNNVESPIKSIAAVEEHKEGSEENAVNNFIKSLHDSDTINPANNQHVQASIGLDLVNKVCDEISSKALEVEDSYSIQEVCGDYSRQTSGVIKENLHISIEQNAADATPQLLNLMPSNEKEPLESSIFSESLSGSFDSGYGALTGAEKNSDVTLEQNSCSTVEENAMKLSTALALEFMSLDEKESLGASLFSGVDENSRDLLAEVSRVTSISNMNSQSSPKAGKVNYSIKAREQRFYGSESSGSLTSSEVAYSTVSCERPMMTGEPLYFKSSLISESLSAKSPGSYCFEIDSCKDNSVDVAGCTLESSMVLVSCATSPDVGVAGQFMTSQAGLVSCDSSQSMESNVSEGETSGVNEMMSLNNLSGIRHGQISSAQDRAVISLSEIDESLANSFESSKEDIQLSDDAKLEESCVFVDDSELHAASCRAQRLRSYKKRIKDAFAPKKRLAKEYEHLAIWYGDSDMESPGGASQTLLPFSSRRSLESRNLQVQYPCETEWELL